MAKAGGAFSLPLHNRAHELRVVHFNSRHTVFVPATDLPIQRLLPSLNGAWKCLLREHYS